MKYIVDIDGTICRNGGDYPASVPLYDRIEKINRLYDEGHHITYWTARGGNSGIDWSELTAQQLGEWGCKYHELLMKKPVYDLWIDDKAINSEEYFK
jgi:hypothetical protein